MTTNETITLTTFEAAGHKLRAFVLDGVVWLIGTDAVIGLSVVNRSCAYDRLGDDEKCYVGRTDLGLPPGRPMVAVSESGFYKLVMRSDKPEAREFQEWVTREVLPAIRRTGGYRLAGVEPEAVELFTATRPPRATRTTLQSIRTCNDVNYLLIEHLRTHETFSPHRVHHA